MRWAWALALAPALCVLAGPATAGDAPQSFAAAAPIALAGDGPYYRLSLPLDVHFAARFPDLSDLRVFNGEGEAMPFSIIRARPRAEQAVERSEVKWFPLQGSEAAPELLPEIRVERRADGTIVSIKEGERRAGVAPALRGYLLDLSQGKDGARALELDWDPAVTGFQQISVEASDDLQHWRRWPETVELARLEYQGQRIERRRFDLPRDRAAYLRLLWHDPAIPPPLTSVVLIASTATLSPAPFVWSAAMPPKRSGADEFEWRLPQRVAAERLKIDLPEVNVLAPVEVWGKRGTQESEPWRFIANAVLYRLLIDGKEWLQQDIALPGQPVTLIKLKLDRRSGGLGAAAPSLSLGVTAEQLLFLARGAGPFVLAVGNADAKAADLAPATLIPGYDTDTAPQISTASLGALGAAVPAAPSAPAALGPVGWKTLALWAVLLAGIACIGAMALYLLRQTRAQ